MLLHLLYLPPIHCVGIKKLSIKKRTEKRFVRAVGLLRARLPSLCEGCGGAVTSGSSLFLVFLRNMEGTLRSDAGPSLPGRLDP